MAKNNGNISYVQFLSMVYAPTDITRPCIYQGPNLNKYLEKRPILPTGIKNLEE